MQFAVQMAGALVVRPKFQCLAKLRAERRICALAKKVGSEFGRVSELGGDPIRDP